jgi:hypothetical protein
VNYCRHCDLFTGYGALGVCRPPGGQDAGWLRVRCWGCGGLGEAGTEQDAEREAFARVVALVSDLAQWA